MPQSHCVPCTYQTGTSITNINTVHVTNHFNITIYPHHSSSHFHMGRMITLLIYPHCDISISHLVKSQATNAVLSFLQHLLSTQLQPTTADTATAVCAPSNVKQWGYFTILFTHFGGFSTVRYCLKRSSSFWIPSREFGKLRSSSSNTFTRIHSSRSLVRCS